MLITVLGVSVGLGTFAPRVAAGAEAAGHGWWNRFNDGATAPAAVAPPDVPSDGLYVAGDVSGPQAIAAVAFGLGEGEVATGLALPLASAGMRGGVAACVVGGRVIPAQNGRWAAAPGYDADRCTEGVVDGEEVRFDVAALVGDSAGYVALAIVPTGTATRAVFEAPPAAALTTTSGSVGGAGGEAPSGAATTAADSVPAPAGAPAAAPTAATPPPAPVGDVPITAPGGTTATAARPTNEGEDGARALLPVVSPPDAGWYGAVGAAIGGVLLFGLLLFYSLGYGPLGARYDR